MSTTNFNESAVREAAYFLWLNDGQPQGQDQDHWLQAMEQMTAKPAKKKAAAKPTTNLPANCKAIRCCVAGSIWFRCELMKYLSFICSCELS